MIQVHYSALCTMCTILYCVQSGITTWFVSARLPVELPATFTVLVYIIHSFILKVYNLQLLQTIKLMNYSYTLLLLPKDTQHTCHFTGTLLLLLEFRLEYFMLS